VGNGLGGRDQDWRQAGGVLAVRTPPPSLEEFLLNRCCVPSPPLARPARRTEALVMTITTASRQTKRLSNIGHILVSLAVRLELFLPPLAFPLWRSQATRGENALGRLFCSPVPHSSHSVPCAALWTGSQTVRRKWLRGPGVGGNCATGNWQGRKDS
jgi:hypothetical protein